VNTARLRCTNLERTLLSNGNRPESPVVHRRIFRGAVREESRQHFTCYGTSGTPYMAAVR
jgi:hypothetical protein